MATIFRTPIITKPVAKAPGVSLHDVAGSRLTLQLAGQGKIYGAPGEAPAFDHSNPQVRTRGGEFLVVANLLLTVLAPASNPTQPVDQPNPQTVKNVAVAIDLSWVQNPVGSGLLVTPIPFSQSDWPNPLLPRRPVPDEQPLSLLTSTSYVEPPKPFLLNDQPNPIVRRLPRGDVHDLSWVQNIHQDAVLPSPFAQHDWPNPRGKPYPFSLRIDSTHGTTYGSFCYDSVAGGSTFFPYGAVSSTFFEVVAATGTMGGASTFFQSGPASSTFFVRPC